VYGEQSSFLFVVAFLPGYRRDRSPFGFAVGSPLLKTADPARSS
jgi:hypothetical protein